jgi:hypothetical protein
MIHSARLFIAVPRIRSATKTPARVIGSSARRRTRTTCGDDAGQKRDLPARAGQLEAAAQSTVRLPAAYPDGELLSGADLLHPTKSEAAASGGTGAALGITDLEPGLLFSDHTRCDIRRYMSTLAANPRTRPR